MPQRIGELLVEAGAATRDAVRDALKNQIIFGGRVGTNLLEMGGVEEEALAHALGRRHGVPFVAGSPAVDPEALRLLKPEVADRYQVVPCALTGRQLTVVARDPSDLAALDAVAFATGKQVRPLVAAEARVWALLRAHYGIEHQLRGIEVDFQRWAAPAGGAAPGQRRAGQELMDEAAFDALYRTRAPGAPLEPLLPPAPAAPAAEGYPRSVLPAIELPGVPVEPLPPAQGPLLTPSPVPARAAPAAPRPPAPPPLPPEARPPPVPVAAPPPVAPVAAASVPSAAAPPDDLIELTDELVELEPAPLGFDEAARLLAVVSARDAIAETVLRYARARFRRAVLLTVNRGVASGWVGLGEGLTPIMVRRLRLALGEPGIVDMVVRTQAHFLGPIPRTVQNAALLRGLGGGVPANAFVVPILAMGRVVNVFYGDAGRGALVDAGGVGELLILATRIAQSYERLLSAVRQAG